MAEPRWIGILLFDGVEEIDAAHHEWLREQHEKVPLMTSVCTGSAVFAAAGLLEGRPAYAPDPPH